MSRFDVTAIVNLHAEGMLAHSSFVSVARAKAYAERCGLQVEVLAVLDRPNAETVEFVESCKVVDLVPVEVSLGDLGRARNAAVEIARGDWIGFIDGDDLWGENWLAAAYKAATSDPRPVVWHPLSLIIFGVQSYLFIHVDAEDEDFELLNLSLSNFWASQSFAARSLYLSVPFPGTDLERQLGYEDWGWNMETIAKGWMHKCVPATANACRKKRAGSLLTETSVSKAMPKSTSLFRDMILQQASKKNS